MSEFTGRDDWDRHWQDYASAAAQNPAQKYRRALVLSMLELNAGDRARLLDVGSGQGDMAATLREHCPAAEILGLDQSQSGVELSSRKVASARFLRRDLMEPQRPSADDRNWATHAVCSEVLEHVDDPVAMLRHAGEYMAPGCRLVVTVPGGPMSAFDRHIGHRRHFRQSELRALLNEAGYLPLYVTGAGFPFLNLYRCVVVLRGKRLVDDVRAMDEQSSSSAARTVMAAFDLLFRLNVDSCSWGWQMVAKARWNG